MRIYKCNKQISQKSCEFGFYTLYIYTSIMFHIMLYSSLYYHAHYILKYAILCAALLYFA